MKGRLELNAEKSLTIPTIIIRIGFYGWQGTTKFQAGDSKQFTTEGKQKIYREKVNHPTWNQLKVAIEERDV